MPKWIGTINVMIGQEQSFVIEAATEDKAREKLYQRWLDECENNCDRGLEPYTAERAEELEAEEE